MDFLLHTELSFAGYRCHITGQEHHEVTLQFDSSEDLVLPRSGELKQHQVDCHPLGITAALLDFWNPIWNRDSKHAASDISQWPHFRRVVENLPSLDPLDLDLTDVAVWRHAVSRLRASSAAGVCGWHNAELKALPDCALQHLALLLGGHTAPTLPPHLLQARVAAISKVAFPSAASHARPITVMSCLYRLWGRVVCLQVIARWSLVLPRPIMGFLRGRSAVDLSYWVLQEIEDSLRQNQDLSGIALDLRRAFNNIPRPPAQQLLALMGLPKQLLTVWMQCLSHIRRSFSVSGFLSPGLDSTTGCPEGDPISVLGMLAVCYAFVHLLEPFVSPRCYADNWMWMTDLPEAHIPAVETVVDFTSSLCMEVDWTKSYFWSTARSTRLWWKKESPSFLPAGVNLPLVSQVKELGAHTSFGRKTSLGHIVTQFQSATDRLHRLFHEPLVPNANWFRLECGHTLFTARSLTRPGSTESGCYVATLQEP